MALNIDAKFEEKLSWALKIDKRHGQILTR